MTVTLPAAPGLPDWVNPWGGLASAAGKVVADAWTAAMLGIWNAGLWLLQLVLHIVDAFTTPDLSEDGPGQALYQTTFWLAVTLMIILTLAQLGIAAFRRDGKSVGRVLIGTGQFLIIWVSWISYGVAVVTACGGLTTAILKSLLHIDKWQNFSPLGTGFSTEDITEATVATVLGFMGVLMVIAAIGHLIVMLARSASLMVLAATTPIAAAGLASDFGRSWFWKSFRWFHAAAFTPVLMALVLGIGVEMTSGVATGMTTDIDKAVGTAVPGVVLICVGAFAPLALFKLLAFVDPGTNSGASLRAGMSAAGGLSGLLKGQGGGTSSAASSTDQHGKPQAESSGESDATGRASQGLSKLGGLGKTASTGLDMMSTLGAKGATIGADVANQSGAGHNQYVPDFSKGKGSSGGGPGQDPSEGDPDDGSTSPQQGGPESAGDETSPMPTSPAGGQGAPAGMPQVPSPPPLPGGAGGQGDETSPLPTSPAGGKGAPGGGAGASPTPGGGGGAGGAGAGGAAATPPPVV